MKTGIFGGTFDPVHIGHLLIAETVLSDFPLERIFFVPVAHPPHKKEVWVTSAEDRVAMLNTAIENHPDFSVSLIEFEKGGVSYTIDMIRALKKKESLMNDELYLIIGGDSLEEFHTWKDPYALIEIVQIVVVKRPGYTCRKVDRAFLDQVHFIPMPMIEINSTEIRKRVKEGKSVRYRVPDSVEKYITARGLYR